MKIRHGAGTENTYVGWILFEADRMMKCYSLGYDNITGDTVRSQVAGYKNAFNDEFSDRHADNSNWERFWIVPAKVMRRQAGNNQLTLVEAPLKVNTERMIMQSGKLITAPDNTPSNRCRVYEMVHGHQIKLHRKRIVTPREAA
jgi:hypothetical protein